LGREHWEGKKGSSVHLLGVVEGVLEAAEPPVLVE
jgi:hypothetical protein